MPELGKMPLDFAKEGDLGESWSRSQSSPLLRWPPQRHHEMRFDIFET